MLSKHQTNFEVELAGETHSLKMDHIVVDKSISRELRNSYLRTAHGRLVGEPQSIERRYNLNDLPNDEAYVSVVNGALLDERVDQED